MKEQGFTVVEILFAVAIFLVVTIAVSNLISNIWAFNRSSLETLVSQANGRKTMEKMIKELRITVISALGAYPIESAATSSLVFFADIDNDGRSEKIRYFFDSQTKSLKRAVTVAVGNPPLYSGGETISTLAENVSNPEAVPIFDFYDTNYAGTSSPLALPADVSMIRLIKITLFLDDNPNQNPPPYLLTSQVSLRNLKDNL